VSHPRYILPRTSSSSLMSSLAMGRMVLLALCESQRLEVEYPADKGLISDSVRSNSDQFLI
jgi:hypothetical protein